MQQFVARVAKAVVVLLGLVAMMLLVTHFLYGHDILRSVIIPELMGSHNHETPVVLTDDPLLASVARRIKKEDPGAFLGNGRISPIFAELSMVESQALFHAKMIKIDIKCQKIKRFGHPGDGGYELCLDKPYEPNNGNCLIYSFGINRDWTFDDEIHNAYKCEVHSFDPSIGLQDHVHKEPNMFFHNLGIWGSNTKNERGWQMKDLSTIVEDLGHRNKTIDMIKLDVEGAEWPVLRHIVDSGVHRQIKQIAIEAHTPRFRKLNEHMTILDFAEIYASVHELEKLGFRKFLNHANNGCCGRFSDLTTRAANGGRTLCCYEMLYVNNRFT